MELLGAIWADKKYKNYLQGLEFEIIFDRKALHSAFSPNHGNKTYPSRKRDASIDFCFSILQLNTWQGKIWVALINSRTPSGKAIPHPITTKNLWLLHSLKSTR